MSMKKPELQDYGITLEQYALYKEAREGNFTVRGVNVYPVILIGSALVVAVVTLAVTLDVGSAFGLGVLSLFPAVALAAGVTALGNHFKVSRALKGTSACQVILYEQEERAYQAAQREAKRVQLRVEIARQEAERIQREAERERLRPFAEHWMSLSGREFERELSTLFGQAGYLVEHTPSSGDQGVDLILRKDGQITVVQCKSHRRPCRAGDRQGTIRRSGAFRG